MWSITIYIVLTEAVRLLLWLVFWFPYEYIVNIVNTPSGAVNIWISRQKCIVAHFVTSGVALLFNLRPAMPVVRCAPVSRILHKDTDYANLASRYDGVKIKKRLVKIEGCLNIEY